MKRKFGLNKYAKNDKAKAIRKLDTSLSLLVRGQDGDTCTTCGRKTDDFDCGHFRRRECMATRFDYKNVAKQCRKCNRFEGGRPYEFGLAIDKRWGAGTAKKLYKLSNEIWQWEVFDLEQLESAAKKGWNVYVQLYDEIAAKKTKSRTRRQDLYGND